MPRVRDKKPRYATCATPFGWCGVYGWYGAIEYVTLGHRSEQDATRRVIEAIPGLLVRGGWIEQVCEEITRYLEGDYVDFSSVAIAWPNTTPFRYDVLTACRRIPCGETVTYAELARRCGSPRGARAVARCMASNHVPIIIPCHRVVRSDGSLGGYSGGQGVETKRRLLQLEAEMRRIGLPR